MAALSIEVILALVLVHVIGFGSSVSLFGSCSLGRSWFLFFLHKVVCRMFILCRVGIFFVSFTLK